MVSPDAVRGVLRRHPSGVAVVTVEANGQRIGLTVATLTSLSLEPPLIGVGVARQAALHELLREAYRLLPDVAEMELVEAMAGLRPGTPDNLPAVGPGELEGLILATGHFRNGILLAPLAAARVVETLERVAA